MKNHLIVSKTDVTNTFHSPEERLSNVSTPMDESFTPKIVVTVLLQSFSSW